MKKEEFLRTYLVDRHNTWCSKWDGLEGKFGDPDLIGMWIADMEFKTPKAVQEALEKRVDHGVFGYTFVPDEYYDALNSWMSRRYQCPVKKDWVRFTTGCVTALAYAINRFTEPGDPVMVMTPIYYPFMNVVTNTDYSHRQACGSSQLHERSLQQITSDMDAAEVYHLQQHYGVRIYAAVVLVSLLIGIFLQVMAKRTAQQDTSK